MRRLFAIPERLVLPVSFAGRAFGLVLCLVVIGITLVPSRDPSVWLTRDLLLRWAALLLLGLAVLHPRVPGERLELHFDVFDVLVLFGMGWFALSAWNSTRSFEAFDALRGFWALSLLWFALRHAWRRWPELFPWFMAFFLGTALMGALWVTIQILHNHLIPVEGPFTNINFAAAFLAMAVLATWVRLFQGGGRALYLLPAILFIAWAAARSRGSLVAMGVALAVYGVLHARGFEKKLSLWSKRQWMMATLVVLVVVGLAAPMVNRLMQAGDHDPRAYWRVLIWQGSWEMAADHPLLGVGPGVYGTLYPYYRPSRVWFNENPFAHNEFLQAAAEGGFPAMVWALLFAGLLMAALVAHSRKKGGVTPSSPEGPLVDAALLATLLVLVHATLDFVLHEWCVALILMALVTYALRHPLEMGFEVTVRLARLPHDLLVAVSVLAVVWMFGVGSYRSEKVQRFHLRALQAGGLGNAAEAESLEQRAVQLAPDYATGWNTLAYLADYQAQHTPAGPRRSALLRRSDELYLRALSRAPQDMTIRENQIEFLMNRGDLGRALDLQKTLLAEAPNHLPSYERQARLFIAAGRFPEAVAVCQVALQKKASYLPAALAQVQALLRMGKKAEALEAVRSALETAPDPTEPPEVSAVREQLVEIARGLVRPMKGR